MSSPRRRCARPLARGHGHAECSLLAPLAAARHRTPTRCCVHPTRGPACEESLRSGPAILCRTAPAKGNRMYMRLAVALALALGAITFNSSRVLAQGAPLVPNAGNAGL